MTQPGCGWRLAVRVTVAWRGSEVLAPPTRGRHSVCIVVVDVVHVEGAVVSSRPSGTLGWGLVWSLTQFHPVSLLPSRIIAKARLRALEGHCVTLKDPTRVRDQGSMEFQEGTKEKNILHWPLGKSIIWQTEKK